jgi:hypothetical protein
MGFKQIIQGICSPLASRKVRVALATVAAAYLAQYGLDCGEEIVLTLVSVGVALILGIAHEDNGKAAGGGQ